MSFGFCGRGVSALANNVALGSIEWHGGRGGVDRCTYKVDFQKSIFDFVISELRVKDAQRRTMNLAPPQGPRRARRAPPGPTAARPVRAAARHSLLAACIVRSPRLWSEGRRRSEKGSSSLQALAPLFLPRTSKVQIMHTAESQSLHEWNAFWTFVISVTSPI